MAKCLLTSCLDSRLEGRGARRRSAARTTTRAPFLLKEQLLEAITVLQAAAAGLLEHDDTC